MKTYLVTITGEVDGETLEEIEAIIRKMVATRNDDGRFVSVDWSAKQTRYWKEPA